LALLGISDEINIESIDIDVEDVVQAAIKEILGVTMLMVFDFVFEIGLPTLD